MSNWDYYQQPTVSELREMAAASARKAAAKGEKLEPIILSGCTIAKRWWGKAWCDNLERYADYYNRIGRGKRYVRGGCVIDLKIQRGEIRALVQGSRKSPYRVSVSIAPLPEERCRKLLERCGRKPENIQALLSGDFPKEMKELFFAEGGLFPDPSEICFDCSCPDWASMCKHVAAALYGVGARLDEEPMLFFELRGIDAGQFVDIVLANKVEALLQNANRKSSRALDDGDISGLFGVL